MSKFKDKVQSVLGRFKMRGAQEEQERLDNPEEYNVGHYKWYKNPWVRLGIIAAVIVIAIFTVKYVYDHHTYDQYRVVSSSDKSDSSVTQYLAMNGNLLRYTGDGASLSSASDKTLWSDNFQMSSPVVASFGKAAAIYDKNGTQVEIYDNGGKIGAFQTDYPILKASVSAQGAVAVILENGDNTLINYYAADGSVIASSSTNMSSLGYPTDLSVSEDGLSMAVSYLVPDQDTISSYLAFYNFGDAGKNKEDNLVDGFRYAGILVPKIQYLDKQTLVAYREDGFSVYKGQQSPREVEKITFDDEIVSSFGDGSHLGFVFANSESNHPFRMQIYNMSGKLQMEENCDIIYDEVKISDNQIILNNATQISVFSMQGVEKFTGNIEEGSISEVLKTGMNRYTVACSGKVITIKLK